MKGLSRGSQNTKSPNSKFISNIKNVRLFENLNFNSETHCAKDMIPMDKVVSPCAPIK